MNTAYITPRLVRWARERAGLSVNEVAGKLKVSNQTVAAWENGQKLPPFGKAEILAGRLHIPFGYLFLSAPPKQDFPLPDLRTVGNVTVSKPSVDFLDVISDTLLKQQWYNEYLRETGAQTIEFVGSCAVTDGFQRVAETVRTALSIDHETRVSCETWEEFLAYITHKAEDLGIVVMQRGIVGNYTKRLLDVNEFRGFAISDDFAPLVFVNSR